MTKSARVMQNNRIATRGLSREGAGISLKIDENEKTPITIDWSDYLGTDTIASVENDATSATVTDASNTDTTTTLTIQAHCSAIIEHRITTSSGEIKELPIFINGTGHYYGGCRYYDC